MLRLFSTPMDVFRPNITSKDLKAKILSSESSIIEHDFGKALGTVYFVRPDDLKLLETLLPLLHKQPDVRRTKAHTAWIVGGQSLLAMPTQIAMPYHKLFTQGLSHSKEYVGHTIAALNEFNLATGKKIRLTTLIREPSYHLLAKGLFEVDQLPADLVAVFKKFDSLISGEEEGELIEDDKPVTDVMTNFAKSIHTNLQSTYATWTLDYLPQFKPFREARDAYLHAAKNFVLSQYDKIKSDLVKFASGEAAHNVLSLSVIEVVKDRVPTLRDDRNLLNQYLKQMLDDENDVYFIELLSDQFIQSVPGNIFAAGNLLDLIPCILYALVTKPDLLAEVRQALTENHIQDDLSNLHAVIEADKKANGILHRIYLEGMRLRCINPKIEDRKFGDILTYHVTNPISINETVIQGGSVVCVMNGMRMVDPVVGLDPQSFIPDRFITDPEQGAATSQAAKAPLAAFSYLPRRCPAYTITDYIAKAFVAYFVMKYDFEMHAKPNQNNESKIQLVLTARDLEQKTLFKPQK